jgi:hypothetical protein
MRNLLKRLFGKRETGILSPLQIKEAQYLKQIKALRPWMDRSQRACADAFASTMEKRLSLEEFHLTP